MIRSFSDKETELIWNAPQSRKLALDMQAAALRKLRQLNRTQQLHDLRVPAGNRLEQMKGYTPSR
ncbi:type II toxin-antitoxin system RelE/ParE family toxin [Novosphingobium sp. 9U]|uniref:type II toxin-antitoxin system RelE/ParE family toxin n=1 Tax=Novosphingobium sp. 9U TaxID=2653158 RepID=UPI0012EF6271|nr:hypothetical protein [Novosphingobium sp. 9U]VWX47343.1 hypothetical protein NOVOSPHI9U_10666 [Novosphingobium sp. 9U]